MSSFCFYNLRCSKDFNDEYSLLTLTSDVSEFILNSSYELLKVEGMKQEWKDKKDRRK
jgi:hypothetical protein